ncbi:MAG: molecular chaperone TorD family protein [Raoultibacter sp.]
MNFDDNQLGLHSDACALFSRIFMVEVTDELIHELRKLDIRVYFSNLELPTNIDAALAAIELEIEREPIDVTKLRVEYAKLFIGPNQVVAPPWGSVYLDAKKAVMGESMLRIRDRYDEFGLEVQHKNTEPDDHIALELSFVSYLFSKALLTEDKLEKERYAESAVSFIGEFLSPWLDDFAENIASSDVGGFYKGFAVILRAYIQALLLADKEN